MDGRLKRRVLRVARELAVEEKERLAAAGTFVEIEDLTAEIGDELARTLAQEILGERAEAMAAVGVHACPDCGQEAEVEEDREPLILEGKRGEIEYQEPRCYCSRCRRAFFPSGGRTQAAPARKCHAGGDEKAGLGGNASSEL